MGRHLFLLRKMFLLVVVWLAVILSASQVWAVRIVVFTPTSENNTYWPQVHNILQSVADDLGIDLDVHEFDVGDRFVRHTEGLNVLRSEPKPDGAIFSVAFGNARPLLEETEALGIPTFIQGPLFPSELPELGETPRRKFKTWVGYFYQDEFRKGYLLGKTLLAKAETLGLHNKNGELLVAGIGGDHSWFGSKLRQDGLIKAVNEDIRATLTQIVPTKWTESEAADKTRLLLSRYQYIPVIWAASDQLAIGVAEALGKTRYKVGRDVVTGGLDLSNNGLINVASGELTATVSGSMLQYAKVLNYLYDYINGIDFAEEVSTEISATLQVATRDNAEVLRLFLNGLGTVDYAVHSKHLNPSLERYDFSMETLRQEEDTAE